MRILQLIQRPQLRGAEIFTCQLSNHLLEAGHEVYIISIQKGDAVLPFSGSLITFNRPTKNRLLDWEGWRQLAHYIDQVKPDVVQANAGDTLKYAVLSKVFFKWKAPIVFRNASTISLYLRHSLIKRSWNGWLFKKVAQVVSVSNNSKEDFIREFPFLKKNIEVIPVGIEVNEQKPSGNNQVEYIIHVGGFTFEKNHHRLINIFQNLQKSTNIQLWLVGDGPLRKEIEKQVEMEKLSDQVRFLGFQQDVFPLVKNARALVMPSRIEGIPGVILEAMYCKTPVIAYDVGGIPEVVKNGVTGWLVKAGDEAGFLKAINEALNDPTEMIIENAYRMVVSEFDNKVIVNRFLEVYRSVIGR